MDKFYLYDGLKAIPLELGDASFKVIGGYALPNSFDISPERLYELVPWVRRTVDIRASALGGLPYQFSKEFLFEEDVVELIPEIERSLLLYGAAYVLIKRVRGVPVGLRMLSPTVTTPIIDGKQGRLLRVEHNGEKLAAKNVIAIFESDVGVEAGPGTAILDAARLPAEAAIYANLHIRQNFMSGGVPKTIIKVAGVQRKEDLVRLKFRWLQFLRQNSGDFDAMAVRDGVTFEDVGLGLDKINFALIFKTMRQQIAAAFGVPQTMIEDAANYATAREHAQSFYRETVLPRAKWLCKKLSDGLYPEWGVRVAVDETNIAILRDDPLKNADKVAMLFDRQIISEDEAREILGLPKLERVQPAEEPQAAPAEEHNGVAAVAIKSELRQWRDVAKKDINRAFGFSTKAVPPYMRELILRGLGQYGANAFDGLRSFPQDADDKERELIKRLVEVISPFTEPLATAIEKHNDAKIEKLLGDVRKAFEGIIRPFISKLVFDAVIRHSTETGIMADLMAINEAAATWAEEYSYGLITGLDDTTRKAVQRIVKQAIETDISHADIVGLLEPYFGEHRARLIATTEVTRAYSQSAKAYQTFLRAQGYETVRVWHTRNDGERVCPICAPLNGKTEKVWGTQFPDGSPAHPGCRCWITLKFVRVVKPNG